MQRLLVALAVFVLLLYSFVLSAQEFRITSANVSNGMILLTVPARADSYYFLRAASSLTATSLPVAAALGTSGDQTFELPIDYSATRFFRIEQIPSTSTNDEDRDGIPDVWELERGLNPLNSGDAIQIAPGDIRSWLQVYQDALTVSQLPAVYFPEAVSTIVAGATNVSVQVTFTKRFNGRLTYNLSGTAIPNTDGLNGDYVQPLGYVNINNATTANISIALKPRPAVETDRSLIISLSAPGHTNQTYLLSTNTTVHQVRIVQSTNGVFLGTLAFTNGLFAGAQSVKMAIRPVLNGSVAFFDVTGNPVLGDTFSVPVNVAATGFQLTGYYSRLVTNTPLGRNLTVTITFGATQVIGDSSITPVSMSVAGLTSSGRSYVGSGTLSLVRSR